MTANDATRFLKLFLKLRRGSLDAAISFLKRKGYEDATILTACINLSGKRNMAVGAPVSDSAGHR